MGCVSFHDLPEPPRLLGELSTQQRERLLALWQAARAQQHAELKHAMDRIVQGVPALFRGTVRKILG